jgi:hypothetical protein
MIDRASHAARTRHEDRAGRPRAKGHGCMMHTTRCRVGELQESSRPLPGLPKRGKTGKILEFIRRILAMFIFSMRTVVLAVAVSASSLSSAAALSPQSELLCSPEGLMRLIPQFNVNGQFTVPDPNADLQKYLSAHQGLSNAIDMILAQENISQNPSDVGSLPSRPLIFASNWLSSEVGLQTDGTNLNSPEAGGKFGGYRVKSFLTGLAPVPLSQGSMYVIKQSNPTYQAFVYPMPTSHPCVNRLVLAAGNTTGTWPPPTYALGRYQLDNNGLSMRDKPLMTYLIVNICIDLGKPEAINKISVLRPYAMMILALHWPCEGSGCANNGNGHKH